MSMQYYDFENKPNRYPVFTTSGKQNVVQRIIATQTGSQRVPVMWRRSAEDNMSAITGEFDAERVVRVITLRHVVFQLGESEHGFEAVTCEDISEIAGLLEGAARSVLMVDIDHLSENERNALLKQMAQFNTVPVLAIAHVVDHESCDTLVRMGFVGSLRRTEDPSTVRRAIKAVLAGELWFPRAILSRLLRSFLLAQDPNRLTSREIEILDLIGNHLNNQQVADKLFLSRETVRWHIKSLHAKLGTRTRRDLQNQFRLLNRLRAIPPQREAVSQRSRMLN
jgi:DNA-binding NarL/FixJ family response regulator